MAKKLSEMTVEELWQLFPIILTEHQDCWADWYEEEAQILRPLMPEGTRINHIGSTSVNGIWAKPIVDILVELPTDASMSRAKDVLVDSGYICMYADEKSVDLNKGYTEEGFAERVFHIHVRYLGDNDELYFRKYLNDHPDVARDYESLKLSLWKAYEHDRDGYTNAKGDFIRQITERAKAEYPADL